MNIVDNDYIEGNLNQLMKDFIEKYQDEILKLE